MPAPKKTQEIEKKKNHKKTNKPNKENTFLIGLDRSERARFRGSLLVQASYNIKIEKQTIRIILCPLDVGGWRKEKGTTHHVPAAAERIMN